MMARWLLALTAVVFTPAAQAGDCPDLAGQPAVSLSALVDRALCANPDSRAAWQRVRTQQGQVGVAKARYYPTLNASASQTRNLIEPPAGSLTPREQTRLALSSDWLLWDFGGRAAGLASTQQTLAALQASADARGRVIAQQALQAAFDQLAAQAARDAAHASVQAAEETLIAARQRVKLGSGTRADELQALTALANARLVQVQRDGELAASQGRLALVAGYPAQTPIPLALQQPRPEQAPTPPPLERLLTLASTRRLELLAQQRNLAAASNDLERIAAQARPSLSLSASRGQSRDPLFGARETGTVGVTATLPLFTGFQQRNQEAVARSQIDQQRIEADRLALQISQEVWQAWHLLRTTQARSAASQTLLDAATESARAALARYEAGLGGLLPVLNAQSSLADARQQVATARHAWAAARLQLAQASGLLLRDPEALLDATVNEDTP